MIDSDTRVNIRLISSEASAQPRPSLSPYGNRYSRYSYFNSTGRERVGQVVKYNIVNLNKVNVGDNNILARRTIICYPLSSIII